MLDKKLDEYNNLIRKRVDECYAIATEAKSLGRDISTEVEIPLANDMAERVEELIHMKGIASEIRELSKPCLGRRYHLRSPKSCRNAQGK